MALFVLNYHTVSTITTLLNTWCRGRNNNAESKNQSSANHPCSFANLYATKVIRIFHDICLDLVQNILSDTELHDKTYQCKIFPNISWRIQICWTGWSNLHHIHDPRPPFLKTVIIKINWTNANYDKSFQGTPWSMH